MAAAQRVSEHILFLQRRQRSFLGRLGNSAARLRSLSSTLSAFSAAGSSRAAAESRSLIPPQGSYRAWADAQAQHLTRLDALLRGSAQLLQAFAAVESAAAAHAQIKEAFGHVSTAHSQVSACKAALQSLSMNAQFIVTPAHTEVIQANQKALERIDEGLQAAEAACGFSRTMPNWSKVLAAMAAAVEQGTQASQGVAAESQQNSLPALALADDAVNSWSDVLERAVTSILLWAQAAAQQDSSTQEQTLGDSSIQAADIPQLMARIEGRAALRQLSDCRNAMEQLLSHLAEIGAAEPIPRAAAMAAQAASVARLLDVTIGALQHVAARYLALHKATAKLSYVASSLFVGLLEEGFCTAEESQEEAVGGEGGKFQDAEGTVRMQHSSDIEKQALRICSLLSI